MNFFERFWRKAGQGRWVSVMNAETVRLALFFSLYSQNEGEIPPGIESQAPAKFGEAKFKRGIAELTCFGFLARKDESSPLKLKVPEGLSVEEAAVLTPAMRDLLVDLFEGARQLDTRSLDGMIYKERLENHVRFGERGLSWKDALQGIRKEVERVPVPPQTKESLFTKTGLEAVKTYEELTGNPLYWDEVELVREALRVCTPGCLKSGITRVYKSYPQQFTSIGFRYIHPMAVSGALGSRKRSKPKPVKEEPKPKGGGVTSGGGWRESYRLRPR